MDKIFEVAAVVGAVLSTIGIVLQVLGGIRFLVRQARHNRARLEAKKESEKVEVCFPANVHFLPPNDAWRRRLEADGWHEESLGVFIGPKER